MSRVPPGDAKVEFENSVPILRARDLRASVEYYVGVLGFRVDWEVRSAMASVSRGGGSVMLCEGSQGNPGTWVWLGVTDAGALFDEYSAAGASIKMSPTNYFWAYEFHVRDPDGHVLRFGSEAKPGMPLSEPNPDDF